MSKADAPLTRVVVQLSDLPAGWSPSPPDNSDDDDSGECETKDPIDAGNEGNATVEFQQGAFGPYVFSGAARMHSTGVAKDVMTQFATLVARCRTFSEKSDDGSATTYRFDPLSFPKIGDDTFAAQLSATTALGPFGFDIVVSRSGARVPSPWRAGSAPPTRCCWRTCSGR